jgi:predicted ATP-dependent Lon-type protease
MPKGIITMLKTYCESGSFARGREQLSAYASLAMFGNTNQPEISSNPVVWAFPDAGPGVVGGTRTRRVRV